MTNEIDEKWIDSIAKRLEEIAIFHADSYDVCFHFATDIVRRCCGDLYTKTNFLAYLLNCRVKIGFGIDDKLYDECLDLVEEINNFDHRRTTIGGLLLSVNRAKRTDLREKMQRRFRLI